MFEFIREVAQFRNQGHEAWFYLALAIFFILGGVCCAVKERVVFLGGAVAYLGISVVASVVVIFRIPSSVYSADCIWFNAVVALVYVLIFFILRGCRDQAS